MQEISGSPVKSEDRFSPKSPGGGVSVSGGGRRDRACRARWHRSRISRWRRGYARRSGTAWDGLLSRPLVS